VDVFKGDVVPDLAVANSGPVFPFDARRVSVLLGKGAGSLQPARSFGAGRNALSVAVGDFNGDAAPDLAVVNNSTSSVSVLLGNADGNFQVAQSFDVSRSPYSVAVGDFNGDGAP